MNEKKHSILAIFLQFQIVISFEDFRYADGAYESFPEMLL